MNYEIQFDQTLIDDPNFFTFEEDQVLKYLCNNKVSIKISRNRYLQLCCYVCEKEIRERNFYYLMKSYMIFIRCHGICLKNTIYSLIDKQLLAITMHKDIKTILWTKLFNKYTRKIRMCNPTYFAGIFIL